MRTVGRHVVMGALTALLVAGFWASRPEWSADMRLWRAVGDPAIVLLFGSLAVGPAAKLSSRVGSVLPWRRQIGIWAATAAALHALLVLNGWARWSTRRLLGYEFIPSSAVTCGLNPRLRPGETSSGSSRWGGCSFSWRRHPTARCGSSVRQPGSGCTTAPTSSSTSPCSTPCTSCSSTTRWSFHRAPVPENWFRFPLLVLGISVVVLQRLAVVRTVSRRRSRAPVAAGTRRQRSGHGRGHR